MHLRLLCIACLTTCSHNVSVSLFYISFEFFPIAMKVEERLNSHQLGWQ